VVHKKRATLFFTVTPAFLIYSNIIQSRGVQQLRCAQW